MVSFSVSFAFSLRSRRGRVVFRPKVQWEAER